MLYRTFNLEHEADKPISSLSIKSIMQKAGLIVLLLFGFALSDLSAQTFPKVKTDMRGKNVSIWVPRLTVNFVKLLLPAERGVAKEMLPDLKSLRVKVINGDYYKNRFERKFARQNRRLDNNPRFNSVIDRDGKNRDIRFVVKRNRRGVKKKTIYLAHSDRGYTMIKVGGQVKLVPIVKHLIAKHGEAGSLIGDIIDVGKVVKQLSK